MNKVKNLYFDQSMLKIYIMYNYHNFCIDSIDNIRQQKKKVYA